MFQAGLQRRGFGRGEEDSAQAKLRDEAFVFYTCPVGAHDDQPISSFIIRAMMSPIG